MKPGGFLKGALVLILVVALALPAAAEEGVIYKLNSEGYWRSYVDDAAYLVTSPTRWDTYDWLEAGSVVGITAGLYVFDQKIQNFAQENRTDTTNNMTNVFIHAGEELYVFPALAALYVYGDRFDDDRAQKTALLGVQSWLYSSAVTYSLKTMVHRTRPNEGSAFTFDGPNFSGQHDSFPSAHASTAWAVASVVAGEYDDNEYVPTLAYTVATLASLSRLNDNQNWASDVFFASATGFFIGNELVNRHDVDSGGKMTIIPVVSSKGAAIIVDLSF